MQILYDYICTIYYYIILFLDYALKTSWTTLRGKWYQINYTYPYIDLFIYIIHSDMLHVKSNAH